MYTSLFVPTVVLRHSVAAENVDCYCHSSYVCFPRMLCDSNPRRSSLLKVRVAAGQVWLGSRIEYLVFQEVFSWDLFSLIRRLIWGCSGVMYLKRRGIRNGNVAAGIFRYNSNFSRMLFPEQPLWQRRWVWGLPSVEGTYGTSIFKRIKRESESLHSMMCNRYIEVWEYAVGAHVEQSVGTDYGGNSLPVGPCCFGDSQTETQ